MSLTRTEPAGLRVRSPAGRLPRAEKLQRQASYGFLVEGEELSVGLWPIELDLSAADVVYPQPDLTTRAQQLHSAAENLRVQAGADGEALVTPSSPKMCNELHAIAKRVGEPADSLTADNV